jgi:hypothetical protein
MDINKFFLSKAFKIITWTIAGLLVLLFVFKAGLFVGQKKAEFSCRWGENYHRNFGGPRGGFFDGFGLGDRDFIEAHGTFGQIIKIDGPTLVVKGRADVEKIILVTEKTIINRFRDTISLADLKVDDYVVVVGEPNNAGQIEAKLIRVMPSPVPPPPQRPFR